MNKCSVIACVLCGMVAAAAYAAPTGPETTEIRIRYDHRKLTSPAAARQLLRRIGEAALESCGASPFSLDEVKTAALASPCWKGAVDDAVRRIHNPLLTAAAREGQVSLSLRQ
jgi:UrcA family protein